ncbi:MAG: phenylphosphate carboxylase subunit delta [Deltaproteobacteria bacterium RBG_16_66_15]|nr:MAG: phenylphosphate carboxylase subunit delta [Deltaproteobacteria bacterium RBG_16_66_15]HAM32267.1 phenylphosphate carboxylase subunit delta [Deltaproteobacteria bacterium]
MSGPVVRQGAADRAAGVRLFLMDVDGVLTDGGIIHDAAGVETKRFHVRDGHGIKMLQRAGVPVGIITGRTSEVVAIRARELGIDIVRQGVYDKLAALREILAGTGILPAETAYAGDDIVDLPLLRAVGFSAAPSDAEPYVLDAVHYVSSRAGGKGAVREITEFLLRARGSWDAVTAKYFPGGAEG